MTISEQILGLFLIAVPIATITRTITHEEIFREPREYCIRRSQTCRNLLQRKMFYALTCEYCFSHYVTIAFLIITRFKLLFDDWRGYLISLFALVWVANMYMNIYSRLRVDIRSEKAEAQIKEAEAAKTNNNNEH